MPSSMLNIQNYFLYGQDRQTLTADNSVKTGLCAYIPKEIHVDQKKIDEYNLNNSDIKVQWLLICLPHQKRNYYRKYVPPACCLTDQIEKMTNCSHHNMYVTGDLHINLLNSQEQHVKNLLQTMKTFELKQFIKNPTRFFH